MKPFSVLMGTGCRRSLQLHQPFAVKEDWMDESCCVLRISVSAPEFLPRLGLLECVICLRPLGEFRRQGFIFRKVQAVN